MQQTICDVCEKVIKNSLGYSKIDYYPKNSQGKRLMLDLCDECDYKFKKEFVTNE